MKNLTICIVFFLFVLAFNTQAVRADVSAGDVIDRYNYQKIEGMVPDSVLQWVKNGEWVLNIGALTYQPRDYFLAHNEKLLRANTGKYRLDRGEIIEVATGKRPKFIEGIPFPGLDTSDPEFAVKLMTNRAYQNLSLGNLHFFLDLVWVSEKGVERKATYEYYDQPMDGYGPNKDTPNPNDVLKYSLYKFTSPYDIAGNAQMLHRFRGNQKQDLLFAYLPAIRRLRRLTPTNRSDGILGSDIVYDDAWMFDGKPADFDWKFIREQIGLVPHVYEKPQPAVINRRQELKTTKRSEPLKYGHEVGGWSGAPWAAVNIVWVKTPIYILEARSKDPYYNYGVQYLWVDTQTMLSGMKVIHDRRGIYWKTNLSAADAFETPDRKHRGLINSMLQSVDDYNRRSSYLTCWSKPEEWYFFADEDFEKFSLSGFQRFSK